MVTLDFETYYSSDFSLSKMSTESYIRSPEFEVIGVGLKKDSSPTVWVTGSDSVIKDALLGYGCDKDICVAHNAAFDMAIMNWRYDVRPKFIVDTLSLSRPVVGMESSGSLRALSEYYGIGHKGTEIYTTKGKHLKDFTPEELKRFGEYCILDVDLTYALLPHLFKSTTRSELDLIDLSVRFFTEPHLKLNQKLLEEHLAKVVKAREDLIAQIGVAREEFTSNEKFAQLLRDAGIEPPTKTSPTTGKETYAFAKTDEEFKALLEHPDERVQTLVSARMGLKSSIEETRTQAFLDIARRGTFPVMLNYYGAVNTGRFCLAGDTIITVKRNEKVLDIELKALKDEDLVWDGVEFVSHGGLVDRGEREVITYQGITGTPDHRVYVEEQVNEEGPIDLLEASLGGYTLETAPKARD